jgi:methyl-accepting chemotaxis protein
LFIHFHTKAFMSLNNLKIAQRLALGFGLVIFLMIVTALFANGTIGALNSSITSLVSDRYSKTVLGNTIQIEVNKTGLNVRDAMLTADDARVKKLLANTETSTRIITDTFVKLDKLVDDEKGKQLLKATIDARATYRVELDKVLKALNEGQKDAAKEVLLGSFQQPQVNYFIALDAMIAHYGSLMDAAGKEAADESQTGRMIMAVLTIIAGILSGVIAWRVSRSVSVPLAEAVQVARRVSEGDLTASVVVRSRDETGQLMEALKAMNESLVRIVGEVRQGTETIVTASNEIANGNADLSARTESQASSLEETVSSMEELTQTVRQNADHAREANELVIAASEQATKGGAVVEQVVGTMGSIKDSSSKIVDIISVIDGIAFQTNILALNAAVEAARAGEQGRGFAVVASEVRNLAQRSAAAAKEIKALIGDSVEKVDAGSKLVDDAGRTMQDIVESVKRVAGIMSEIASASHEQSTGIEEINGAIAQMDQMTQQNAALVEEAAAAASSMKDQAANLVQVVSVFRTGVLPPGAGVGLGGARPVAAVTAVAAKPAVRRGAGVVVAPVKRGAVAAPAPRRVAQTSGDDWEEF